MDLTPANMTPEYIKETSRQVLNKANEVPGFDPTTLLSRFGDEARGYYNYLKAAPRLAWFRLAHPEGRIAMINHSVSANHSFVEAQVFFGKDDQAFTANGFAWMERDDTQAGQNHLKSAQTNAMCIALGNAGFGTPVHARFNAELSIYSQTEDITEVPLDMGTPEVPSSPEPSAPKKPGRKPRAKGNLDDLIPQIPAVPELGQPEGQKQSGTTVSDSSPGPDNTRGEDIPLEGSNPGEPTTPDDPAVEADVIRSAEIKTLDEAMAVVIRTGAHRNKSFLQLSQEVPNFKRIIDFYANPIGDTVPEDIKTAAEFIRIHKFGGE